MPCCRTAARRLWSAGPGRWTGCVSRGSTRPPPSPASWIPKAGISRSGRQDEANKFFGFLADAAASQLQRGTDLQIMFGIDGERDLSERQLPHLAGWRDSRPVRVGNGAWTQRQLDVYGELLGAAQRLVDQLGELDPVTRRFLAAAADTAGRRCRPRRRAGRRR
jgi:hypothetical protein